MSRRRERWASRMIEGVMSDVNQLEMKASIGEILNRWPQSVWL
jgi:hypothetical protein